MIRHVFTLAWQRKKSNALLILELLIAFLVLFSLAGFGLYQLRLYRTPLGFEYADTWGVEIRLDSRWDLARDEVTLDQIKTAVAQLSPVVGVHTFGSSPFIADSGSSTRVDFQDLQIPAAMNEASDGALEALGVQLLEGRWFGPQDEGQAAMPIVVNRALGEALGGTAVVGIEFPFFDSGQVRIVGVFDDFRLDGEFTPVQPLLFYRRSAGFTGEPVLVLQMKPGVTAQFEDELMGVLKGLAPNWEFDVNPWSRLRAQHIREFTLPLLLGGIVVGFLLLLVGCGMLGVLWQNIIRRMPEMGLRRAVGATAGMVRIQVIFELLAITAIAVVVGLILLVQLPLSGWLQVFDWGLFIPAAITSTLALLGLCALFALYPSYQATRCEPVEALRHE